MIAGHWLPRARSRFMCRHCQLVAAALLACSILLGRPAVASEGLDRDVTLDIPAQPLSKALLQFGHQANVQISLAPNAGDGQTSKALKGKLHVNIALSALLRGSGLSYQATDNTVTIHPAAAPAVAESKSFRLAEGHPSNDSNSTTQNDGPEAPQPAVELSDGTKQPVLIAEVVVTGTNIRGVTDSASPITTIDRSQIDATGLTTTQDLLRTLPENVGGIGQDTYRVGVQAQNEQSNRGYASGVNLRGLGSDATLVLLNGHRLPTASNGFSVDISTIPLAAIDHVDVFKDGGSAIYGSDAVAGVVNFVTIKQFRGVQTTLTGGTVTDGGKKDLNLNQMLGTAWSSGSIYGSYTFNTAGALNAADRLATATAFQASDAIPPAIGHSLYLAGEQAVGDLVHAYLDVLASDQRYYTVNAIKARNPVTRSLGIDPLSTHVHNTSLVTNGSVIWSLPFDWRLSTNGQFATSSTEYQVSDPFNVNPADIKYKGPQHGFDAVADGRVVDLPAGPVKMAVGISNRRERYASSQAISGTLFDLSRNIRSAYGELFIPIMGSGSATRTLQRLELTVADRYDRYSDFGGTNNPKFGVLLAPDSNLTLRASYSTSFRAPLLKELEEDIQDSLDALINLPDPSSPTGTSNQLLRIGGNPDLRPQTAHSVTAGLDFHPEIINGLSLSLDYFSIDYKNRIGMPATSAFSLAANPSLYGAFLTRNPSAALVQAIESGPYFLNLLDPGAPSGVDLIGDDRLQNLSSVKVEGLDFDANVRQRLNVASLNYRLGASYFLKYADTLLAGTPPIDRTNTPYYPTKLRLRASVNWSLREWSSTAFVNYSNAYSANATPTQVSHVGSWMTLDGQLSYHLPAFNTAFKDASVAVSVQNVLDRRVPFVLNPASSGRSTNAGYNYDPVNASILGRYLSLRLMSRW